MKLLLTLSLALLLACTALTIFIIKYKPEPKTEVLKKTVHPMLPVNGITLTGVPDDKANDMVMDFYDETRSSHKRTAIWFSMHWLETIIDELSYQQKHQGKLNVGIRIYPAKDAINNTVIISSTSDDAQGNHVDYFDHVSTFQFSSNDIIPDLSDDLGWNEGARLFLPTTPNITPCNTTPTDPHTIRPDDAWNYVSEFRKKTQQGMNTMSEWFPLDVLNILMDDLKTAKIMGNIPDGIRLYLAKNTNKKDKKHFKRHCFIFFPTIEYTDPKTGIKTPHRDDFTCYDNSKVLKALRKKFGDGEENGEECPNNCDGTALPAN